ncbi:DUF1653 domain-containing protein [Patescibacteria group bacterium]|nr:DUF1653 domain-containing protein [Patescibacteria group bacterium]
MKIKLGRYQHFKGDIMEVVGEAKHSESLEEFVVYKHITGKMAGETHWWVRPEAMFLEQVEVQGQKISRFKYLEEKND